MAFDCIRPGKFLKRFRTDNEVPIWNMSEDDIKKYWALVGNRLVVIVMFILYVAFIFFTYTRSR